MATGTKAKPAKKGSKSGKSGRAKAAKPAAKDDVSDLESEIEADLAKDFDYEGRTPTGEELMGKDVRFEGGGKTRTGKVIEPTSDGDESMVVVEDDEALWDVVLTELEVVEAGKNGDGASSSATADDLDLDLGLDDDEKPEPAKKGSKSGKSGRAKAAEKPTEKAEKSTEKEKAAQNVRERRRLPVADVKIPKKKLRDVDEESTKFKAILASMKADGQEDAILVESFDRPVLIDGLRRLRAAEKLGWTDVEVMEDRSKQTKMADDERIWRAVVRNETREADHWTDLARAFVTLTKGEMTARKIGRALGISESRISKMMAAVSKGLDKGLLEIAEAQREEETYGETVFLELAGADDAVQKRALEAMQEKKPFTVTDVRNLKRAAKKGEAEEDGGGGESGEDAQTGEPKEWTGTHKALSREQLGDYIRVVVHGDRAEIKFTIDWDKKTFRNFDPVAEFKDLLEATFAEDPESEDGGASISSLKELQKAMTEVKSELSS